MLPAPGDEELARLTESLALRMRKFLQQRGLGPDSDPEEADPLSRDQSWLAGIYAASNVGKISGGDPVGGGLGMSQCCSVSACHLWKDRLFDGHRHRTLKLWAVFSVPPSMKQVVRRPTYNLTAPGKLQNREDTKDT